MNAERTEYEVIIPFAIFEVGDRFFATGKYRGVLERSGGSGFWAYAMNLETSKKVRKVK